MACQIDESTYRLAFPVDNLGSVKVMIYRTICFTTIPVNIGLDLCNLKREILIRLLVSDSLYCIRDDCLDCTLPVSSVWTAWLGAYTTETGSTVGMNTVKKNIVIRETGTLTDFRTYSVIRNDLKILKLNNAGWSSWQLVGLITRRS